MKEGLPPEHSRELLSDSFEQLLDGRGVADEGGGHLEAPRGDVADGGLDVVWNFFVMVELLFLLTLMGFYVFCCFIYPGECNEDHMFTLTEKQSIFFFLFQDTELLLPSLLRDVDGIYCWA